MPEVLTPLEGSVYNYLLEFTAENTYQPSIRDIGKKFQIKSTKTVSDLLQSLARKGYIERDPARSRGVRLLGFTGGNKTKPVPYYGKIHAGEPSLLPEDRKGFITMDRRFIPAEEVYFLKVKGDSMIGRAISDGDFVMVNPVAKPKENDIVAARLGEEATVKTLSRFSNGTTVLSPANPADREIEIKPGQDFGILGVVCGVFRPFVTMEQMTADMQKATS
jgi:repressor LexA